MSGSRNIDSNNVGSTPPIQNSNSGGNSVPIYMSLQGLLYQAMSDIVNCLQKERLAFFDAYSKNASVFGGLTQNSDGSITIDKDSSGHATGGMLGSQIDFGIKSANDQEQATKREAYGMFGAAAASGLSLVATAGFAYKTRTTNEQTDRQTLHSNVGKDLNSVSKIDYVSKANVDEKLQTRRQELTALRSSSSTSPTPQETANIQTKEAEIAQLKIDQTHKADIELKIQSISKDRDAYAKFAEELKSTENSTAAQRAKKFNEEVVEHMKGEPGEVALNKVRAFNEALQNSVEKEIDTQNSKYMNATRTLEVAANAGGQSSQAGGKTASASSGQAASEEKLISDIETQLNQTFQTNLNNLRTQTDSLQNEAGQIAGSYAQWGRA